MTVVTAMNLLTPDSPYASVDLTHASASYDAPCSSTSSGAVK